MIFKVKPDKWEGQILTLSAENTLLKTQENLSLSPCNHSMVNQIRSGCIKEKRGNSDFMALFLFPLVLISNDCEINKIISMRPE